MCSHSLALAPADTLLYDAAFECHGEFQFGVRNTCTGPMHPASVVSTPASNLLGQCCASEGTPAVCRTQHEQAPQRPRLPAVVPFSTEVQRRLVPGNAGGQVGSPTACSAVLSVSQVDNPVACILTVFTRCYRQNLTASCSIYPLQPSSPMPLSSARRLACADAPDLEVVRAACGSAWAPVFGNSTHHLHLDLDAATSEPTQCSTQCSKQIFNLLACTVDEAQQQVRTAEVAASGCRCVTQLEPISAGSEGVCWQRGSTSLDITCGGMGTWRCVPSAAGFKIACSCPAS